MTSPSEDFRVLAAQLGEDLAKAIVAGVSEASQGLMAEAVAFHLTLNVETDRGCVLMAAAYLDEKLEQLIGRKLVQHPTIQKDLFGVHGAAGTFSSRITLAYLLGLIAEETRRDILLIKKIRNEFAHNPSYLTLDAPNIKSLCMQLASSYKLTEEPKARTHFVDSVAAIVGGVIRGIEQTVPIQALTFAEPKEEALKLMNSKLAQFLQQDQ